MVTAGVYLLIRSSSLIEYSSTILLICLWLGSITTIFSSLIGLFQQDIKKVIAYSTMSQLAREYIFYFNIFRHQTICVETLFRVNSQITKARDNYHYNIKFFNSSTIIGLLQHIMFCIKRWKFNIIRKLVGISEAIRLILVFNQLMLINYNLFKNNINKNNNNTIINSKQVFTSNSNIKYPLFYNRNMFTNVNDTAFKQWLAGLIDGDGYFLLSKNGYNSCEITMDARDKKVLYLIQHIYGGSVKQISNALAFKYKLRNKLGLIALINDINGYVRNPTRLLQMNKLCVKFNIQLKYAGPLSFNNGWFSGFIDSDGSICI